MADTLRVLYVDDERDLLEIGKLFLEQSGDLVITTVLNAPDAIRLLEGEQFDAIVSDYQMPGMDGIQFLIEVRTRFGPVPFILFTGKGREDVVIQAINSGADFYLQKGGEPQSQFAELSNKIRYAVKRKRAEMEVRSSHDRYTKSQMDLNVHQAELATQAEELRRTHLELEESRDKYLELYEYAPLGYLTLNDTALIEEVNITAATLLGVERSKLLNARFSKFVAEKENDQWHLYFRQLLDKMEKQVCTLMLKRGDGSTFPARLEGVRIAGSNRGNTRVNVTISDISDIRNAEGALKRSEEEYRRLVEQSSDGIWLLDKEFLTVYVNPAMELMLGYKKSEMTGRSWYDFGDPVWVLRAKELEMRRESGIVEPHEFLFIHKDGRKVLTRISTTPLYDNDGSFDGAMGILSDITERKQVEESLRESEEQLRGIFNTVSSGIAIYEVRNDGSSGKDYIIKDFNKKALEIEGKRKDEVIGRSLSDLRPAIEDYGLIPVFRKVWSTGVPEFFPQKNYVDLKYSSWYENRVFRLHSGEIVAVYDDITDRKQAEEALAASEEKYHTIADFTYDWEYWMAPDGNFIYVSPSCERITGYSPDEFILDPNLLVSIIHPDDRDNIIDHLSLSKNHTRDHGILEFRIIPRDGEERWIGHECQPVFNTKGDYLGKRASNRDITERKIAEKALKTSQTQLSEAMDLAHLVTWEFDVASGLFTFDDRFYTFLGTTAEIEGGHQMSAEVYAKNFVHPDDQHVVADEVRKAITATDPGFVSQVEHRIIRRDGEVRYIVVRFEILKDEHGRTIKTQGANQDITDLKRTEAALRETNEYLNSLFDYANAPIIVWDPGYSITRFNHAFEDLTRLSEQEVLGKKLDILFPKESRDTSLHLIKKTLEGEQWETVEIPILVNDGRVLTVLWNSANILDTSGRIISTIAQGVDITRRTELEKEMKYHEQELMQLSTTLAKVNRKQNLLSSITRHDINNQLLVLNGFLALLHKKIPDPGFEDYFTRITRSSDRISAMIKFTKEYEEIGVHTPTWQDIRILVEKAANQAPLGQVIVKNGLHPGTEVLSDPLILRVFYNLMDNAVRYGVKITTIRLSALESGDDKIIVCEDDGDGIPGDEKEKIFERGFGKNTGMGLFLVREILDITGITIRENGEPGKGARFEITVPKGMWRMAGMGS